MTYKIDKNIEQPRHQRKYPWRDMEIGDSFFVPDADLPKSKADGLRPSMALIKTGFKITRRTVTENGVRGIRIWRVA